MPDMYASDSKYAAQLADLRSVVRLFDNVGIDYWIGGGWAVDFHLGEITRRHSDIDVVVHHADKERLHEVLISEGYAVADDTEPDAEMIYEHGDLKLDLSFIVQDDGLTVSPGWEMWPWPVDSFSSDTHQLLGVTCRVISVGTLLIGKRDYESVVGEPLRPRDIADIEALEKLTDKGK